MKNNKMQQRQTDTEAESFVNAIFFTTLVVPLIVGMARPIFDYYDPSGEAFWVGLYIAQVIGSTWTLWKFAKFMAAGKTKDEGGL